MKQLHLSGKLACALIATVAFISGCQKKNPDTPPVPEATPAPAATPAPVTPQPTTRAELSDFMKKEDAKWSAIVKDRKITAN